MPRGWWWRVPGLEGNHHAFEGRWMDADRMASISAVANATQVFACKETIYTVLVS